MLSTDDETRTALGLDGDDPVSALELARQAWEPYFRYIEPGVISGECAYAQMLDRLIMVANDIHVDDEEMFEAASELVTLRSENLDLKLTEGTGESYQEAARVIAHKHRRTLMELLTTLGVLYRQEENRAYGRDWIDARNSFGAFDRMTEELSGRDHIRRDDIRAMHQDLEVLGPRLEHYVDALLCVREQLLRMELLAKARYAVYHGLAHVTRAAYWMDEHRG